uniref:Uncharacterized protein n=1 Tax=Mus musculus TaxID=10090 RepID=Q3UNU5_MOUSE|nr:unnamed protein product [Mus musculus]
MMLAWLVSLLSMEVLLLAKPYSSFQFEPAEGSLAGGTWITVVFDGLDRSILYPNNGSQLQIDLVSVAIPTLRIPCDVSPAFVDLPVVTCQTRSLPSEADAGPYSLEMRSGEQVLGTPCPGSLDSCTFKPTPKSLLRALTSLKNSQKVYQAAGGCDINILIRCFMPPSLAHLPSHLAIANPTGSRTSI